MGNPNIVQIAINGSGAGWADCILSVGANTFPMDGVSYCTDALGDLLRAALQIATGGREATCAFDREPHEWRLVLQRDVDPDHLFLRILEFPDFHRDAPTEAGDECFRAECAALEFTLSVERAATALLAEKGEGAYQEWWGMPFPHVAPTALKAAHSYAEVR